MFGVSVGVQRIPIALAALTMILAALLLARAAGNLEAGLWAAAGLAVAPRLVMFGRRIFIDIYISMFMALTLMFFALAERYPERRRLFLLLMYDRRARCADERPGGCGAAGAGVWCTFCGTAS